MGDWFQVKAESSNQQIEPAVAGLADGGYVVVWTSGPGSDLDVVGQRYGADGTASGPEFHLNTYTPYTQNHPSIAALADGGFVATWTSYHQDGDGNGVYGQVFNEDGTARGAEFRANEVTTGDQDYAGLTATQDGGFFVTWMEATGNGTGPEDSYGRKFDANGQPTSGELKITADVDPLHPGVDVAQLLSLALFLYGGWLLFHALRQPPRDGVPGDIRSA